MTDLQNTRSLLADKNYAAVIRFYEQHSEAGSDLSDLSHVSMVHIISALMESAEFERAEQLLDQMPPDYRPADEQALLEWAGLLTRTQRFLMAFQAIESFVEDHPATEAVLLEYTTVALRLNRQAMLIPYIQNYLDGNPDSVRLRLALGSLYIRCGHYEKAIAAYSEVRAYTDVSEQLFSAACGIRLARLYAGEVEAVCTELATCWQNQPAPELAIHASECFEVALRQQQALAILDEALTKFPEASELIRRKSDFFKSQGRLEEALHLLYQCVAGDPSESLTAQIIALEIQLGHLDKADKLIKQALTQYPRSAALFMVRAELHKKRDDMPWVESDLLNVLYFHPAHAEAHIRRGNMLEHAGNPHAARVHYRIAAQGVPAAILQEAALTPHEDWLPLLPDMKALLDNQRLSKQLRGEAALSLARYYDDTGEWQQAWRYAEMGNSLLRTRHAAQMEAVCAHIRAVEHYCATEVFPVEPLVQESKIRRIFLLGMPQAGLRLMESLLLRDPRFSTDGSSFMIRKCVDRLPPALRSSQPFPACMVQWDGAVAHTIRNSWRFQSDSRVTRHTRYLLDTTPVNAVYAELLQLLFPDALFVHLQRPAEDIATNSYLGYLADSRPMMQYRTDIACTLEMIALYERRIATFAANAPEAEVLTVPFAELVQQPAVSLQRIKEVLGIAEDTVPSGTLSVADLPLSGQDRQVMGLDSADLRQGRSAVYPALQKQLRSAVEAA